MKFFHLIFIGLLFVTASCTSTTNLDQDKKFDQIYAKKFIVLQDLAIMEADNKFAVQKIPSDGFLKEYTLQHKKDPEYWSIFDADMTDSAITGGLLGILEKGTLFKVVSIQLVDNPWTCRTFEILIKIQNPKFSPYPVNAGALLINPVGLAYSDYEISAQLDPRYVKKLEE